MSVLVAVWSPDGRRIAFIAATNDTPETSVWVMNADGSARRRLGPIVDGYPRVLEWSPDGRRILYEHVVASYTSELWSMQADGTAKRRLVEHLRDVQARWSPNGQMIAYTTNGGLYLMCGDGSGVRRLARDGMSPRWSPDGKTIVFLREIERDAGTFLAAVYAVVPEGGKPRRLSPPRARDPYLADVSPDGRWVLVGNYVNDGLALVPLGGGRVRRLTQGPYDYEGDWSPDGKQIAYIHDPNLWIVETDGSHPHLVAKAPGYSVMSQALWKP